MRKVQQFNKKKVHSEPVYNEVYLKTKIKSCDSIINKHFHQNKITLKVHTFFVCH